MPESTTTRKQYIELDEELCGVIDTATSVRRLASQAASGQLTEGELEQVRMDIRYGITELLEQAEQLERSPAGQWRSI
jgi:hypothetical protein